MPSNRKRKGSTMKVPPILREMLSDFQKFGKEKYISSLWLELNQKHVDKLISFGYENFKHTIALQYFTWLENDDNSQLRFLTQTLGAEKTKWAKELALQFPRFSYTTAEHTLFFNTLTLLFWEYLKNQGLEKERSQLNEPLEGNPPALHFQGQYFSQDIANSLLEFDTINQSIDFRTLETIMEIGAGYGRDAYVWLKLNPIKRYIIVDVPPALYISQRYLSNQFPEKKIFPYRNFSSFDEIKEEYETAELVFLMPWQIDLLPGKSIDLICSIDSIHEMHLDLINFYFKNIHRLGNLFYIKCFKKSHHRFDGIKLKWGDYPTYPEWKALVDRECRVQTDYFETLYEV